MNDISLWPALRSLPASPPPLAGRRAVWGKVHGARSDFRWIARSDGFQADDVLARALLIGSEDAAPAQKLYFWRPVLRDGQASGYVAGVAYPSRATDAAGRRGFLEKQLLAVDAALPAAAAALLCLPAIAAWTDEIWWGRAAGQDWSRPGTALSIVADTALPVSAAAFATAIAAGLEALDALDPVVLQDGYARLLAGERPVGLVGLAEPLPPAALAALLLPLEPALAGRLALAGWIPSRRYELAELGKRWDVLALPEAVPQTALSAPALAQREQAGLYVQALRERNPALLRRPAAPPSPRPAVGGLPDYHLHDPDWPIVPGARLALSPPVANASGPMRLLYEFAAGVDRRVLVLKKSYELNAQEAAQLCLWAGQAGQAPKPHYAEPRQWQVKLDLLRALAWLLAPADCVREKLALPGSKSFLWYAPTLITSPSAFQRWLAIVGESGFAKIVNDSQSSQDTKRAMRNWVETVKPS